MAARKIYDLAVKTREYTNAQGEKKANWQNVGSIMEGDDGRQFMMLARWFNPAGVPDHSGKGGDSVPISMFEPRDRNQGGAAPQSQHQQDKQNGYQKQNDNFDDDMPF